MPIWGSRKRSGQLIMTEHDWPSHAFGGSDSVTANNDGGPVAFIAAAGIIDLGQGTSDSNEISGGIAFNAGSGTLAIDSIGTFGANQRPGHAR